MMVRSFVYLLLLFVVFLTGMLLGIDREKASYNDDQPPTEISAANDLIENEIAENERIIIVEESNNEQAMNIDKPLHLTQKTASFLEAGVKGFYEIIVEVLYQFSTLFF